MFKMLIQSTLSLLVIGSTTFAHAQSVRRPDRPVGGDVDDARLVRLERGLNQLQRQNDELSHRLRVIEDAMDQGYGNYPPPIANLTYACSLTDSGFSKTFLAIGKSQIDAEFNVKQKCEKDVHASYCTRGAVKCDSNMESRARGFICMITDSGFSKTFRGEGETLVAAEANAKINCQGTVHASYCVKNAPRCEEVY